MHCSLYLITKNHRSYVTLSRDISWRFICFCCYISVSLVECTIGFYGKDCEQKCEYCNRTLPRCRQADGYCFHGCTKNLNLPKCTGLWILMLISTDFVCISIHSKATSRINAYLLFKKEKKWSFFPLQWISHVLCKIIQV